MAQVCTGPPAAARHDSPGGASNVPPSIPQGGAGGSGIVIVRYPAPTD